MSQQAEIIRHPRKYQVNIALESMDGLCKIMGVHRKRPVVMRRWRKLSAYFNRSVNGKAVVAEYTMRKAK